MTTDHLNPDTWTAKAERMRRRAIGADWYTADEHPLVVIGRTCGVLGEDATGSVRACGSMEFGAAIPPLRFRPSNRQGAQEAADYFNAEFARSGITGGFEVVTVSEALRRCADAYDSIAAALRADANKEA